MLTRQTRDSAEPMTDTTQADVLVPSFAPAAHAKSKPRQGYLFGPWFDFLTLRGAAR